MIKRTIHSPCYLARLLVAPANWSKVGLVVHKATIESRLAVRARARDMDLSTARWVLQILEHCHIFAYGSVSICSMWRG